MKLAQPVIDLGAQTRAAVKVEVAKDGTAAVTGLDTLWPQYLGEEDAAHAARLNERQAVFLSGTTLGVGGAIVEAMKKHKNLTHVSATVPLSGKDTFTVNVDREKEFSGGPTRPAGTKVTKFGVVNTQLNTVSAERVGQMLQVTKEIGAEALAAFGS